MKLSDLSPEWLRFEGGGGSFRRWHERQGANGILFVCPLCFQNNNHQRPGVHSVICWEPEVPQSVDPKPGRWIMLGTDFNDLTLQAGSSSILLLGGCNAHFFIRAGQIQF